MTSIILPTNVEKGLMSFATLCPKWAMVTLRTASHKAVKHRSTPSPLLKKCKAYANVSGILN